jgi:polyisoprenoid-binding protein YceI
VKHPIRWLLGGLVVVLVAVVGFGAWYLFADDAPPPPTLDATPQTTTAGGPATPDGTWKVAPGDDVYVGYRIKEIFAGDTIKKDAVGRTPKVSGMMLISGNTVGTANVTADVRGLKSNRATRDNYIRNNALETASIPEAKFVLAKPITLPGPLVKGKEVKVDAAGTLTLHNISHPVTVPLTARWDGNTIEVAGTAPIALADYDMSAPDTGVVKVDDNGSLELKLTFVPA